MQQGKDLHRNVAEMEEDVNAHMIARKYAEEFTRALSLASTMSSSPTVTYHTVNLVLLAARSETPGPQDAMFLEPFLTGRCSPCFPYLLVLL